MALSIETTAITLVHTNCCIRYHHPLQNYHHADCSIAKLPSRRCRSIAKVSRWLSRPLLPLSMLRRSLLPLPSYHVDCCVRYYHHPLPRYHVDCCVRLYHCQATMTLIVVFATTTNHYQATIMLIVAFGCTIAKLLPLSSYHNVDCCVRYYHHPLPSHHQVDCCIQLYHYQAATTVKVSHWLPKWTTIIIHCGSTSLCRLTSWKTGSVSC